MTDRDDDGEGSDLDMSTPAEESPTGEPRNDGGILEETPSLLDESRGSWDASKPSGGVRRRLAGFLALLLGAVGMLVAIALGFLLLRTGFGARGIVDDLFEPVDAAIDRLEIRIDQADDAVTRGGVDSDGVEALATRSESLVDMAVSAKALFGSVQDQSIYRYLPADLSKVDDTLSTYETSATKVNDTVSRLQAGQSMPDSDAQVVADEIDSMQTMVGGLRESLDDAGGSLRRWIRISSFGGLLGALWGMWSQFCLARVGLRVLRGRAA